MVKRLINNEKFQKFSYYWIIGGLILSFIIAIATVFIDNIIEEGVTQGIFLSISIIVMSTLCFLIGPMFVIVLYGIVRYIPTLAIPIYIVMMIGYVFGETEFISDNLDLVFKGLYSIVLSSWGIFNILTSLAVNEAGCDINPITIIE